MKKIIILISFFSSCFIYSQDSELKALQEQLPKSKTELDKISILRQLMQYYNGYGMPDTSKIFLEEILAIADGSPAPALKIEALLNHGVFWNEMKGLTRNERFLKTQPYFKQALEIARNTGDRKREAWSHYHLSISWQSAPFDKNNRIRDEAEKALNIALEYPDDSLYIYSYLRTAIAYRLLEKNYEQAYMNLDKALMKAIETDNPIRLRAVYKQFIDFYFSLNDPVKESEYIDQLASVTKKHYRVDWEIEDLRIKGFFVRRKALGPFNYKEIFAGNPRLNSLNRDEVQRSTEILLKAFTLLKTSRVGINWTNEPLFANLFWNYFWLNEPQKLLELQSADSVITAVWRKQSGKGIMNFKAAEFYLANQPDSVIHYLEDTRKKGFINEDGFKVYLLALAKKGDMDSLLALLEKSRIRFLNFGNYEEVQRILLCLDSLYKLKGDHKQASLCLQQYVHLEDSLDKANSDKSLWFLQANNAEKIAAKLKEQENEETNRRHSLQYIGITIAIATVFILLAIFGFYRVSTRTIRILGFFSFLMLFEFLFLVFKKYFYPLTRGEPWKELMFMIAIAAILIPMHHWIEQRVFHFLTSNKMSSIYGKTWWKKITGKNSPVKPEAK